MVSAVCLAGRSKSSGTTNNTLTMENILVGVLVMLVTRIRVIKLKIKLK